MGMLDQVSITSQRYESFIVGLKFRIVNLNRPCIEKHKSTFGQKVLIALYRYRSVIKWNVT